MSLKSYDLIRHPIITEKSTVLAENGKYVFIVALCATKQGVTKAIEEIFAVKVTKVNMLISKGKVKRFKGTFGRRSDTKKAIVTLGKDYTIDFTGGIR